VSAYASIDDLRSQLGARTPAASTVEYAAKMLHKVPSAPVVDRAAFILEQCRGKRVLEFGASGPMHAAIVKVAELTVGVDREASDGVIGFDLDNVVDHRLPNVDVDVVICGEVIEHLSNPGWFLTRLRRQYPGIPVVITVPNAFSQVAAQHIVKGVENVNRDHVAWYSYRTLMTLLERHGYTRNLFAWYNGQPHTAEGLIVVAE
jgi:2-polyprenyl-3-methyl-5-hydroxy-6-metoxy-1,4-benzoquinol methylase